MSAMLFEYIYTNYSIFFNIEHSTLFYLLGFTMRAGLVCFMICNCIMFISLTYKDILNFINYLYNKAQSNKVQEGVQEKKSTEETTHSFGGGADSDDDGDDEEKKRKKKEEADKKAAEDLKWWLKVAAGTVVAGVFVYLLYQHSEAIKNAAFALLAYFTENGGSKPSNGTGSSGTGTAANNSNSGTGSSGAGTAANNSNSGTGSRGTRTAANNRNLRKKKGDGVTPSPQTDFTNCDLSILDVPTYEIYLEAHRQYGPELLQEPLTRAQWNQMTYRDRKITVLLTTNILIDMGKLDRESEVT